MAAWSLQDLLQRGDQLFVVGAEPDGDPQRIGKAVGANRAGKDSKAQQSFVDGRRGSAKVHENEVRVAVGNLQTQLAKLVLEVAKSAMSRLARAAQMLGVVESGDSGSLSQRSQIERKAGPVQVAGQV